METPYTAQNTVRQTLEKQRDESDARAIINEVERINTLEGRQRYRWIWELVQNAKDEAGEGVDITCVLTNNRFTFSHNGKPFLNDHLLALLRKTSTKSIDGKDGNTGKFGTGFVTSHLMNKSVEIRGIHKNQHGEREFEFLLDRQATTLTNMQSAINRGIDAIEKIDGTPAKTVEQRENSFSYRLTQGGYEIAKGGIEQLETNLPFAMLVNRKIRSITVQDEAGQRTYSAKIEQSKVGKLSFISIQSEDNGGNSSGLLFLSKQSATIAAPVIRDGHFSLKRISQEARLFKDLPLIGTESLNTPVIIQNLNFLPTEPRDGVRTRVASESDEDTDVHALTNRNSFQEFVDVYPEFLKEVVCNGVRNRHLLAESGLPDNVETYYGEEWYLKSVQEPLREAAKTHPLVKTVNGDFIPIENAVFIDCKPEHEGDFYSLLSKWYPKKCPDENSYEDWVRIISQQTEKWPEGITVNAQRLVSEVASRAELSEFEMDESEAIIWLQELITYLETTDQITLGREFEIYPNQDGKLVVENRVYHHTNLAHRWKKISNGMSRRLEAELLPEQFKSEFVQDFDEREFLIDLNTNIGKLPVNEATPEQIQAVIDICCSFRRSKAQRREQWFELLHELLPELAPEKVFIEVHDDYQFEPAEKCSLKYVCSLIESSTSLELFAKNYFGGKPDSALQWLNQLYDFVFRNAENKAAALVYKIVPTQDGLFKHYTDEIFRESNHEHFDDTIKGLYAKYTGKGDSREFLVNTSITTPDLKTTPLQKLTGAIDAIFNDRESEDKVKEGMELHDLFLRLKEWTDNKGETAKDYFPIFCKQRPVLYIKAFGGEKFSRLLKLNKSVEEIEQLDSLRLKTSELKKLDDAVAKLGSSEQLLMKAREMIDHAELIRWRQAVGAAAEQAFLEAIGDAEDDFDKENPDVGRDFVIKFGDKEFSVELKSAVEGKETVKMSLIQADFASKSKTNYALCVISRPTGQLTTKEQFIDRARFVTNIGDLIGDKVSDWRSGLRGLDTDGDVRVELDSKSGAVNIRKGAWKDGQSFEQFVVHLRKYFGIS